VQVEREVHREPRGAGRIEAGSTQPALAPLDMALGGPMRVSQSGLHVFFATTPALLLPLGVRTRRLSALSERDPESGSHDERRARLAERRPVRRRAGGGRAARSARRRLGRESLRETPRRIATLYSELLTPRDRALRRRDRGLPARTRAPRGDRKPARRHHLSRSFFVSRVDAKADARLSDDSPLRGKLGIANARAAYGLHQERFAGPAGKGSPSSAPRGKGPCGRAPRPKTPLTVTSSTWSSSRCRVRS
jgi:hypothetical protein